MHDSNSLIRRFLLWYFRWPATAHFSVNLSVDATELLAYLRRLRDQGGEKVTVNHLMAAAVGQVLTEFPLANAKISRKGITLQPQVNIAMPVNLIGHHQNMELSMGLVENVAGLSLRQVAKKTTKMVSHERKGRGDNKFVRRLIALGRHMPLAPMHGALSGVQRAIDLGLTDIVSTAFPMTAALTNPGSTFKKMDGALFRGSGFALPSRLVSIGTLWALSAIQDEVIVIEGQPAVRPMLPIMLLIDHRLLDGVATSRMLLRFVEILQAPEAVFGANGHAIVVG